MGGGRCACTLSADVDRTVSSYRYTYSRALKRRRLTLPPVGYAVDLNTLLGMPDVGTGITLPPRYGLRQKVSRAGSGIEVHGVDLCRDSTLPSPVIPTRAPRR